MFYNEKNIAQYLATNKIETTFIRLRLVSWTNLSTNHY